MKLNENHLEALKSIGFDLAAEQGVLTEYFNLQKTDANHFTEVDGVVKCKKTREEIVNAIFSVAVRHGINTASYEVCVLLEKAAAERKAALKADVENRKAALRAELAALEALA